jgi:hypothetical protein
MKVIRMDKKVEYRGHKTCSRIRGKIRPKVRFDRRCRTDWVPDIHRTYTGHTQDIHRTYTRHTQDIHSTYTVHTQDIRGDAEGMNAGMKKK